jgi:hypothetical protein
MRPSSTKKYASRRQPGTGGCPAPCAPARLPGHHPRLDPVAVAQRPQRIARRGDHIDPLFLHAQRRHLGEGDRLDQAHRGAQRLAAPQSSSHIVWPGLICTAWVDSTSTTISESAGLPTDTSGAPAATMRRVLDEGERAIYLPPRAIVAAERYGSARSTPGSRVVVQSSSRAVSAGPPRPCPVPL